VSRPKKLPKKPPKKPPECSSRQLVYPAPEFTKEELAWHKVLAEGRKEIDRHLAIRDWLIPPPWTKRAERKAADPQKKSKPGTAAAWINELHPNDWHLMSAGQMYREAAERGCTLTLRSFQRALKKKHGQG